VDFGAAVDWSFAKEGPLWSYHLHQFDYLRHPGIAAPARARLVLDWIARHPRGVGWDAHPISLRTFSWVKLLLAPETLPALEEEHARIRGSLAAQAATLADNLETHLLANHYLSNLLALTLVGLVLEDASAATPRRYESALLGELARQVLPDGSHLERSPMYHALLLEAVLDLVNVCGAAPETATTALEPVLRDVAARMLGALHVWTHPDGEIGLFADSAFGIAQSPARLTRYAADLGIAPLDPPTPGLLDAGGYVRLASGPFTLIASVAGPMPSYQPGHAHCDALAFELSVDSERVVTDTGVAEYVAGPLRDWSRATRAHATLEVDGTDQAECWGSHRIGGRPRVELVGVVPGRRAEATCASWSTPDTLHRRVFMVREDAVEIRDAIEGRPRPIRLQLPLAPGTEVHLGAGRARLGLRDGSALVLELPSDAAWRVENAACFPEFGRSVERPVLVGEAQALRRATWRLRR
jgi:uncharacterized heparinase superfamily protein